MIGKARRERRRQARAAIERYEYQHWNDQLRVEAAEQRAKRAEQAEREQAANLRGMAQRLDDANAELARWGLEPVTRDGAESDEHPARYRRASDWRTYRSAEEIAELLERSNIDPEAPVEHLPCVPRRGDPSDLSCVHCGTQDWKLRCPVRSPATARDVDEVLDFMWRGKPAAPEVTRTPGYMHYPDPPSGREWGSAIAAGEFPRADMGHYESDAPAVAPLEMVEPGQPIALDHPAREVLREARLETVELRDQIEWLRNAREADLAVIASELGWPGEDPITASGLCLRIRDAIHTAIATTGSTRIREAEAEVERLRAELASRDPGEGWIELAEFEAQRTEAEQLQRSNDRLTAEVTRLTLLQENLTPLPPAKGDVITVNLRDGRTQRCTVLSVMPVGDLGFSLSLEPESPPL